MAWLQSRGLARRDIRPEDIWRDDQGRIREVRDPEEIDPANPKLLKNRPCISPLLRRILIEYNRDASVIVPRDSCKSDVYSVGVVMLYLSLLELPAFLTQPYDLQRHTDECLIGLRSRYSPEWINMLGFMLKVEENDRLALDLQIRLNDTFRFDDDEPNAGEMKQEDPLKLEIKSGKLIVSPQDEKIPCMVTITGGEQHPMDFVFVIDVSGSMGDEYKLQCLMQALINFVNALGDQNRVSLVEFSDSAIRKCGLIYCTQQGKERIIAQICGLETRDLTNMTAGFLLAVRVLNDRKNPNPVARIMLVTDGVHDIGDSPDPLCQQAMIDSHLEHSKVFCFGIGSPVDDGFLKTLAYRFRGEYYHIATGDQMQTTFARALDNMTSVVATNLEVELEALESQVPCAITEVYSEDGSNQFTFQSLSRNERLVMIAVLKPEFTILRSAQCCESLKAKLRYYDDKGTPCFQEATLSVKFVNRDNPDQDSEVYGEWTKVQGLNFLKQAKQLRDKGRFGEAQGSISSGIETLRQSGYEQHREVKKILEDLERISREGYVQATGSLSSVLTSSTMVSSQPADPLSEINEEQGS